MHVVIFEGQQWKTFAPVALSRPVFMLATGMSTLLDKQLRHVPASRLTLWVRPELEASTRQRIVPKLPVPTQVNVPLDDEPALLISGRTLHFGKYEMPEEESVSVEGEDRLVCWAYTTSPGLSPSDALTRSDRWMRLLDLPQGLEQGRMASGLADLIHWNEESLMEDWLQFRGRPGPKPAGPFHVINEDDVWLGEQVELKPGCVLDASKGPIVIQDHVSIGANSVIEGPCFIGAYCRVRACSFIRAGVSAGAFCRLGGEIAQSIIFGHSNKGHEGFLGHSYVGKWVNLGAGTVVSNVKNTLGEVSIRMGQRVIPTGRRRLGTVIGDHTRTAVGTRLMTGSYVGFCCQLAGSAVPPRFVPSFTYWTDSGTEPYRIDKAIEVIRQVYGLQNRSWEPTDEQILHYVAQAAPQVEQ